MFPLSLLNAAENHPVRVELKNGESYNGLLFSCDTFMNLILNDVLCTCPDGVRFWDLKEVYIRGSNIKFLHVPDEALNQVQEERERAIQQRKQQYQQQGGGNSGRGHRGNRSNNNYRHNNRHNNNNNN